MREAPLTIDEIGFLVLIATLTGGFAAWFLSRQRKQPDLSPQERKRQLLLMLIPLELIFVAAVLYVFVFR
jgi:uncharacterized membrane protein